MSIIGTFVEAMRTAAEAGGAARGFRFYTSPRDSEFRSYAQFDRQARADAIRLADRGHRPGEVVILAYDTGLPFIRALYATFYAGLVAAPVAVVAVRDPAIALRRLEAIINDSGSRLVLTDGSALAGVGVAVGDRIGAAEVAGLDSPADEPADETSADAVADAWTEPAIDPSSLAVLQYTSGSTGTPKGVMVAHANLVANQAAITRAAGIGPASRTMGWLPHYHDMGLVGQLLQPISVVADSVLTSPSQFLRRPALWPALLSEHRSTHTVGPDFAYALCTRLVTDEQLAALDLSALEGVITGAEPVRMGTLRAFAERFAPAGFRADAFIPAYGMAETTLLVTAKSAGRPVTTMLADAAGLEGGAIRPAEPGAGAGTRVAELVSCGPPADGHHVVVVDPVTGRPVAEGAIGEVLVSGPSVAQGYWRRPDETAAVFGATVPGDPDGRRFLRTGDLGALVDGELVVTGRLKDLIIIRGRNIYPQDLETSAQSMLPDGCLSAAFEGLGSQPVVGLVAEVDPRVGDDAAWELAERLRRTVADAHLLPELGIALIRKGTLPRTTSGKVQRGLTRSMLADQRLATVHTLGFDRAVAP